MSCGAGYTSPAGATSAEQCYVPAKPFLDTALGQITISFLSILGSLALKVFLILLERWRNDQTWKREPALRIHNQVRRALSLRVENVSQAGDAAVQFIPIVNDLVRAVLAAHPTELKSPEEMQKSNPDVSSSAADGDAAEADDNDARALLPTYLHSVAEMRLFADLSDAECERIATAITSAFRDVSSYGRPFPYWLCCPGQRKLVHLEPWFLVATFNIPNFIFLFPSYEIDRVGVCDALPVLRTKTLEYHKPSAEGKMQNLPTLSFSSTPSAHNRSLASPVTPSSSYGAPLLNIPGQRPYAAHTYPHQPEQTGAGSALVASNS